MGHRCKYYCNAKIVDGKITFFTKAVYKTKEELVYTQDELGKCECRYIYYIYGSYLVSFPNEKLGYYFGNQIQEEESLTPCYELGIFMEWKTFEQDIEIIKEKRPELKYLINKMKNYDAYANPKLFLKTIQRYKENENIENFVNLGFIKLALDKRLDSLTKQKQKDIILYIKNNIDILDKDISLSELFQYLKYPNEKIFDRDLFVKTSYNLEVVNYLYNQKKKHNDFSIKEIYALYLDYERMCKDLDKDMSDKYWRFPNDLCKKHDDILIEVNNKKDFIEEMKDKRKDKILKKVVNENLQNQAKTINDLTIYFANNYSDIKNQADILHQCLITCNYTDKIIKQKSLLVFIKQNNQPVATAEIDYKKNILQFYGDEIDRENCKPSKKVEKAFNEWLSQIKIKKTKLLKEEKEL